MDSRPVRKLACRECRAATHERVPFAADKNAASRQASLFEGSNLKALHVSTFGLRSNAENPSLKAA